MLKIFPARLQQYMNRELPDVQAGFEPQIKLTTSAGSLKKQEFHSTSYEMLDWMKHKLEPRLKGEISITSDMQMTPCLWQKAKRNQRAS